MRFDVLSRSLNVFDSHFLQASAGTGKTFAIEHLVARLLLDGPAALAIDQILVVTFTRAATRELKLRIRKNLFCAKEELLKGDCSFDYLRAICEEGEKSVKEAVARIDAALICYDAAQIYTLHGFCHRILKEFAFEADVTMEVSDPDEKEHTVVLEQMIKEHLKEKVFASECSPWQINALLKRHRGDHRKMISSLATLAGSGNEIAAVPSHEELLAAFLKGVSACPQVDASLYIADLSILIPQYKQMTGKEIRPQVELVAQILASKKCTPEQFDQLLVDDFFLEKMHEKNKKVRSKFPEDSSLHYPGLVQRAQACLLPFIKIAKDPARIALRLAKEVQISSRNLLEKGEIFSHDALLLKVEQALKMPRFVQKVRQKFCAAIIDEFQDTDPVQWNIFKQLFLLDLKAVCLVGDPKQSIYAFRNADVYVYMEAAKAMGSSAMKYLDTNFRSTAPLVEALNLLFCRAQGKWMNLPASKESLEVIPVKAASRLIADDCEAPVEFFIASDKKGKSRKFPKQETLEKKVFPYIASEIHRLHTEKGIEYHQIAILVKDRFQGQDIIDYLKKCSISASAKRGGSLLHTPACFALIEILSAACAPSDMGKIKAALGGPLIAWSEQKLAAKGQDPGLLEAKAKMQSLNRALFEKGFGLFLQVLLSTSWGDSQKSLLEELFLRGDLPLYMDLRKLTELLIEEELSRGLKGEAFLFFLEQMALQSHPDEERLKVFSQEEKGSVTVMTIHMSKGLEFDAVFALGVGSRHPPSDHVVVKAQGRKILTVIDSLDPASQQALEEIDAEKMRQFYVALTRAKRRLYIPLMIEEGAKELEMGEASPSELFFARIAKLSEDHTALYRAVEEIDIASATQILDTLSPLIRYRILNEMPSDRVVHFNRAEPPPKVLVAPPLLRLPHFDEQVLSFSLLAKKDHFLEAMRPPSHTPRPISSCEFELRESSRDFDALKFTPPDQAGYTPLSPHTMPVGAATGHLLHLLFEKIFKRRLHHPLNQSALADLIDEEISFSTLEPWKSVLLPWIVELLTKPIAHLTFSLSDVPGEQLQQEMEFLFPMESGLMKGFADLFFEFGGKYYILDWKSNYLGPTDEEYTLKNIQETMRNNQYELQASIYAAALERYVKLFDKRPFLQCFGGAIYYFVRGKAIYHFIPDTYTELQ
jgi:exodeoxyribonuclease V beta subunit